MSPNYTHVLLPNGRLRQVRLFDGKVSVISSRVAFDAKPTKIVEVRESHTKFDGQLSKPMTYSIGYRKGGSAVLIFDVSTEEILLVEQVRPAVLISAVEDGKVTFNDKNGRIIEIVAGGFGSDTPEECARREVLEETGIEVEPKNIFHITDFYLSPGGSTEYICLFFAPVFSKHKVAKGGGLEKENEDVKCHWVSLKKAKNMLWSGEIADAKTIIAIQWLLLNHK